MLKRQRPISPLPSADVPFVAPDLSHPHHNAKKRRIVAPVLDGDRRGWGRGVHHHEEPCDADDEYDDEEDEQSCKADDAAEGGNADEQPDSAGMYKSTNSLLHDLHALHQHRLIFSNPSTPSSSSLDSPNQLRPVTNHYPTTYDSATLTKATSPIIPEPCQRLPTYFPEPSKESEDGMYLGEVQKVKERYEDTNRVLGSLVLSRRRELQGDSRH